MSQEVGRLKKSRSAQKNVLQGLIVKTQNLMKEGPGEGQEDDVNAMLQLIKTKKDVIANLNDKICDLIEEDDIEADVEACTVFDVKIGKDLAAIDRYMKMKKAEKDVVVPKPEEITKLSPGRMLYHRTIRWELSCRK